MAPTKRTPTKRVPTKRVNRIQQPVTQGVPAGRLLELSLETNLPENYVVTDTISIVPPTKARADKIRDAQMVVVIYNQLLNEAMSRSVPEDQIDALRKGITEAVETYNRAFFGDAFDDVLAFFESQPAALWDAFERDIQQKFFPNTPVDGKCQTCGHVVDEDAEGKAPESTA